MTINYWDGTGHFLMYLFMLDGIARGLVVLLDAKLCVCLINSLMISCRQERRSLGLYWFGSVFNSMIVLLCGSVAGRKNKFSILSI